jgi:hypothetical protein
MHQDDLELDYGQMEGEIPEPTETIRESYQMKGKASLCPVCPARFTNVRWHVLCSHLPWYIAPNSPVGHAKYNLHRRGYSKYIPSTSMTTKKIHTHFQLMNMVIHG